MKCNELFNQSELTIVMDGGAGSSGKGKLASYIVENSDNWQFCCNAFGPQAGHWVKLRDGRTFFYQTLNSCAYAHDKFEKMYIGPGAIIELPALLREIEENNIPRKKLGISPNIPILSQIDTDFERGVAGFDGTPSTNHDGTSKFGSTAHGVGSVMARRALRRPSLVLAKDVPELKDMICDVPGEIINRLLGGQAGMLEIAQGFQLSLLHDKFYPYVTSRNVTTSQALSDMFLPPMFGGNVIINFRTFPIRINNNKYIGPDGVHLTWAEVQNGAPHTVFEGNSGYWYPDQEETTWEKITADSESPFPIFETTSVTKLPRRVATFSRQNVEEALVYNSTGKDVFISINFSNYIDHALTGVDTYEGLLKSEKFKNWMMENLGDYHKNVKFIGTGAETEATIYLGS
jgi:hypothetical protein